MAPRRSSLTALCLSALALTSGAAAQSPALGPESAALRELRESRESTPPAPGPGTFAQAAAVAGVSLDGTGLDPDFAARLQMPAIPIRVTPRLARTLGSLRTDPRMRRILTSWIRHAGRYRARIERTLLASGAPAALLWLSAAESGFDPRIESSAGAVGLWQFMPDTGRSYGLRVDAWLDERRDPTRATASAVRYLTDLRERLGSWELAFAAYNMGYNGVLRAARKYNTNDFEALASMEAGLPFETVEYVPRILSLAIAAQNAAAFGFPVSDVDAPVAWDVVLLDRSVSLADLAREASVPLDRLRELNPALLRARTPPVTDEPFALHVPAGTAAAVRDALARLDAPATRAWTVRVGEDSAEIARRFGMRLSQLLALSGLTDDRSVRPGVTLLVPDREPAAPSSDVTPVVPVDPALRDLPVAAGRQRVWLRVTVSDDLGAIARALNVSRTDLVRWNGLDPSSRVLQGMWIQAHVTPEVDVTARAWPGRRRRAPDRGSVTTAPRPPSARARALHGARGRHHDFPRLALRRHHGPLPCASTVATVTRRSPRRVAGGLLRPRPRAEPADPPDAPSS
ncbi:MAG: transglycosylase SLT domain-containing protein [Polyangiales bacterium]